MTTRSTSMANAAMWKKNSLLPNFERRGNLAELMDAPDCDERLLLNTIRQFASINRLVARYRTILKKEVINEMLKEPGRPYHLVDMGAGGCDIDAWLLRKTKRLGLDLRITACDLDPRIVRYAQSNFGHIPGLDIVETDLLDPCLSEPVDFVFANHFLHHLTDEMIVDLLKLWVPRVRHRLVFSDLARSRLAYMGFSVLSLFYRRSFTRYDGLISIQRGFTWDELEKLAGKAREHNRFNVEGLAIGRLVCTIEGAHPDLPKKH